MAVNADKPGRWKKDIAQSVDFYNNWFIKFAPATYRQTRADTTRDVEQALTATNHLRDITPAVLKKHPEVLPIIRMASVPPLARDRLIGLAGVPAGLVRTMELSKKVPSGMKEKGLDLELTRMGELLRKLADVDILPWLQSEIAPSHEELHRASTIIADRLCGAVSDPIIRNAQEARQLAGIKVWLEARGYAHIPSGSGTRFDQMMTGSFAFHLNVPTNLKSGTRKVNIPVDVVVMPKAAKKNSFPLLIEAKSAGDFTNVNKRRKEEAQKIAMLQSTYGNKIRYILFLCGYFDSGYLGYEAAEGIDWAWEHRTDDLSLFGL